MNPYAACSDWVQDYRARKRAERIEQGAGRVVMWNEKLGCTEERWDWTGNWQPPASARITPRRGLKAV